VFFFFRCVFVCIKLLLFIISGKKYSGCICTTRAIKHYLLLTYLLTYLIYIRTNEATRSDRLSKERTTLKSGIFSRDFRAARRTLPCTRVPRSRVCCWLPSTNTASPHRLVEINCRFWTTSASGTPPFSAAILFWVLPGFSQTGSGSGPKPAVSIGG